MAENLSGAELIAAERARQIEVEGWTPEHDAGHAGESLAIAAACYALPPSMRRFQHVRVGSGTEMHDRGDRTAAVPMLWPWTPGAWKPTEDRVRELSKAGALCAAEIDRLLPAPTETDLVDPEAIHGWFGLSYSSYLVLHRTLLQSMPGEWQREFVHLLEQLRAAFRHVDQTECYDLIPGTEALVNELGEAERKRLGITTSIDGMTGDEYEAWLNGDDTEIYYEDTNGDQLEGYARVVLPGAEKIPPYNRGRTRLEPDLDAYAQARRGVED